jgi:hypothetical protein
MAVVGLPVEHNGLVSNSDVVYVQAWQSVTVAVWCLGRWVVGVLAWWSVAVAFDVSGIMAIVLSNSNGPLVTVANWLQLPQ